MGSLLRLTIETFISCSRDNDEIIHYAYRMDTINTNLLNGLIRSSSSSFVSIDAHSVGIGGHSLSCI